MSVWNIIEHHMYLYMWIVCAILCFSSSAHLNFRFLNTPGWQPICTKYYTYSKTRSRTLNHDSKCTCLWSLKNMSWICVPFSKFWKLLCKNAPHSQLLEDSAVRFKHSSSILQNIYFTASMIATVVDVLKEHNFSMVQVVVNWTFRA